MTPTLLATLFATCVYYVDGQSSCTTPSGGKGTCKSIYQCDALLDLVNKNDRTPDDIHLLHKSQCGSQGTTPSLCCPETCHTPDNQPGRCVSIFTCPNLLNLLRLPVSQETMQYLQYSRCLDSKQFSVCCGPPPILSLGPTTAVPATNNRPTEFALPSGPPLILNQETLAQKPATSHHMTPFALPHRPPSVSPLVLNLGSPAVECATNCPVTTSTLPPNPTSPITSTDALSANRVVDGTVSEPPCRTPSGEAGTCKSIHQCDALLDLVTKKNRTLQETDLLKKYQCGYHDGTPSVCCPEQLCYTPEGQPGKCISIYSCPHLSNILSPSAPKETIQYILNSRCQSSNMYSVCCGPPPNLNPPPIGNCATTVSAFPPDPRTECCGVDSRVDNEIVAPGITNIDQYPWLVMIEYIKDQKTRTFCAGALISGRYVVTAAHCLIGSIANIGTPKNIRLGEYNTTNEGPDCMPVKSGGVDCTEGVIVIPIEQIIPHPEYNHLQRDYRNDIALIRMQTMAPFTDFIRPICLPQEDLTMSPPPNWVFYAAGWGAVNKINPKSQLKLHVDLPYVSMETCQSNYKKYKKDIWHKQVCAGGILGKDTCKGDTGGPLMYQNGRIFDMIGITSFGPSPCGIGIPGVYTKVYEFNTWIRRTIKP